MTPFSKIKCLTQFWPVYEGIFRSAVHFLILQEITGAEDFIFARNSTDWKQAGSELGPGRSQDSHSDWFCHSSHLTSPQSPSPGPSTNHKPTGFPINITYLPNSRKRFNNLTVTSNMRLETSFQVQKKFPSQLKSYNGGITLAWAILVDKDKFNKKHKKTTEPPSVMFVKQTV